MTNFLTKIAGVFARPLNTLGRLIIAFAVAQLLVRSYEYFAVYMHHDLNINLLYYEAFGYYADLHKMLSLIFFFLVLFVPLYYLIPRVITAFVYIFFLLYLIVNVVLIQYFIVSLVPLDQVLFQYDLKDIIFITRSSSNESSAVYFMIALVVAVFVFLVYYLNRRKFSPWSYILSVLVISMAFISSAQIIEGHFNDINAFYLVKNKNIYLIERSIDYYSDIKERNIKLNADEVKQISEVYRQIDTIKQYEDVEFPLIHKILDNDKLGDYIKSGKKAPNIVFIIMESMGRGFSAPNAKLGSFSPFLDSLSRHSLYWENHLSNCERTFGVLPNIFGSLPFGSSGFAELENQLPDHHSLLHLLKLNGYYTSFYYGGWKGFNNMYHFLKANRLDKFISDDFGEGYPKVAQDDADFSWGYSDEDLYRKYIEISNSNKLTQPTMDVVLTLSLHVPFIPPRQDYYHELFDERLKELNVTGKEKDRLLKYKNQLSTVIYADDALRNFFTNLKKQDSYQNTIFVITGDHQMGPIFHDTPLDKYHVPLIIFSPMLKDAKKMSSISSHLDITPTFIAYLKQNYGLQFPESVHYMGRPLDFEEDFRNTRFIPFMRNNKEVVECLYGNYFLNRSKLFRVDDGIQLTLVNDEDLRDDLVRKLDAFKKVNNYVYYNNKIIPLDKYLFAIDK